MEQFEGIRRDRREGLSIRQLSAKYRMHRRTVRAALADAVPPPRKIAEREAAAFGAYEPVVRSWLTADLDAPRKQWHTARRVWQRLLEEHDAQVAESTVRPHVARLKVEVGLARKDVTVPQTHPPAAEAEVDFGQFEASIAAVDVRAAAVALGPPRHDACSRSLLDISVTSDAPRVRRAIPQTRHLQPLHRPPGREEATTARRPPRQPA